MMMRKESIAVINEGVSANALSEPVLSAVSSHVSAHLRSVLQTAAKFARHSYHPRLQADDVHAALRVMGQPAVYGYRGRALKGEAPLWRSAGADVYVLQDDCVDFTAVLSTPLPSVPLDPTVSVHWMAIEGVQPTLPQNANDAPQPEQTVAPAETRTLTVPPPTATAAPTAAEEQPAMAVRCTPQHPHPLIGALQRRSLLLLRGLCCELCGCDGRCGCEQKLKLLTPHVLSKEQQTFFEKCTCQESRQQPLLCPNPASDTHFGVRLPALPAAIKGNDSALREAALTSLVNDAGLQQLLPYFVHFISDEVSHNLRNLHALHASLQLSSALLTSKQLFVEPYLHQLLPSLLTCLLGKHLCADPSEDHWSLREYAAALIAVTCHQFGVVYTALQPRITRTLLGALLDVQRPLTTHYGAIVGIATSASIAPLLSLRRDAG